MQYSSQQFSPEVYELASTYRLGAPTAKYRWTLTLLEFIWMIILGFWIILSIAILTHSRMNVQEAIPFVIIPILCILYYVECFRRLFWRVYVFADGFIYLKYGKPDVFRWEDVYALRQRLWRYIGNARPSYYVYWVERSDGHTVVLNNHINWIADLGVTLNERITAAMLPEVFEEYRQGKVIEFGPLEVNREGISEEGEHLPWSQIADISLKNGFVSISMKEEKRPVWAVLKVEKIPNVFVFMTLAEEAVKRQRS